MTTTSTRPWASSESRSGLLGAVLALNADSRKAESPKPIRPVHGSGPARVIIAGGGVAGLESLLALNALAGDRVRITLLAPEAPFIDRSLSVDQPFGAPRAHRLALEDIAHEFGARFHRAKLDRVEAGRHRAITRGGEELPYDVLILALGARSETEWRSSGVLTYRGASDGSSYRLLLHQLRAGRVSRVAFVQPGGTSWPSPLYDLALATAADCAAHHRSNVELSIVTPETEPLAIFGKTASAEVGRLLEASGVTVHTSSYGSPSRPGWLSIRPGVRGMEVDWVVTLPRLVGPRLRGIPCDPYGFITTDAHGRVAGGDGLFAAGDATTFAIKQGGLAAQQADAVAEQIAAWVGVDIDPEPFRPVLRSVLTTDERPLYLRADIGGGAGDDSTISDQPLWWPPNRISARYLAPYLESVGGASDPMTRGDRPLRLTA